MAKKAQGADVETATNTGTTYTSISHFLESGSGEIAALATAAIENASQKINADDLKVEEKLSAIKQVTTEKTTHKELAEYFLIHAIHEINHYESYTNTAVAVPDYDGSILDDLKETAKLFLFAPQNSIQSEFYQRIIAALQSAIAHIEAL